MLAEFFGDDFSLLEFVRLYALYNFRRSKAICIPYFKRIEVGFIYRLLTFCAGCEIAKFK